jgi:uncharacterized protein related to proFAR isomerase|tara:strand:+ start:315 stop:563 length:249 start_codon:yes stop_codon:yes gene_type:complete
MYSELINKTIDEVTKIFVDAGVQEVPSPKEIREEFEIIDKVFITNEMIKNVELDIAGYLDHKYGTVDAHIQGLLGKWTYQNR